MIVQEVCTILYEVTEMLVNYYERFFILAVTLVANVLLVFMLVGSSGMISNLLVLSLIIFNFMLLAKTMDKLINAYENFKNEKSSTTGMQISQ